jgi:DNA-binding phage protein
MKYNDLIARHLQDSGETAQAFARRAGVSRATLYRALDGIPVKLPLLEKLLRAAGFSLAAVRTAPSPSPSEEDGASN